MEENKALIARLEAYQSQCKRLETQIETQNSCIDRLNQRIYKEQQEKNNLSSVLAATENKLEEANNMIVRVGEKYKTEKESALYKISEKLKSEYTDFVEALDLEMDVDLGENMREQLRIVFKILEKNGIELK